MAFIIIDGMMNGIFTGRKLEVYINNSQVDYVRARAVVNGTNKAAMIAGYAKAWQSIIERAVKA